jgi:hypothetical protein
MRQKYLIAYISNLTLVSAEIWPAHPWNGKEAHYKLSYAAS